MWLGRDVIAWVRGSFTLAVGLQRRVLLPVVRVNAHLDGQSAVEGGGGHDRPMLGKGIGWEPWIAMPLGTGRKLPPVQCFHFI